MITWSHATNQNAASPFPQVYGCKNSRVFVYYKGPLTTKSHTLQSHSQMTPLVNKNVTSPFSPGLWSSNYPQWWLKVRGNQPQSLMTLWSCDYARLRGKWKTPFPLSRSLWPPDLRKGNLWWEVDIHKATWALDHKVIQCQVISKKRTQIRF